MLVASLAVSCVSTVSRGATTNQQSTATAATTVPAAAGQTLRGTGYSFSLPTGWRDTTTEQMKAFGRREQVDLATAGPGRTTNVLVVVEPNPGGTLADLVAAGRKGVKEYLGARLLGQPERLSLAGTPAMAYDYTLRLSVRAGPVHGRQVVCLRDDKVYTVSFSARPQAFATDRAALDQILRSWSWG